MITLYRKNKLGVGTWRIWADGNILHMAHANIVGGSEVFHQEEVPTGLAGRTLEEQVQSRIRSRINRQMDKGYVSTLEEAINRPLTNMLDQPPPMLAKKITDVSLSGGITAAVQPKLDGFRCMVTRDVNGQVICYSRQGKILPGIVHIAEAVDAHLGSETILDGEIYAHGIPLQDIASRAKRLQPRSRELVYHVYDSVSRDTFPHRYAEARDVVGTSNSASIVMVKNQVVSSVDEAWSVFRDFRSQGYEGAMLRSLNMPYESGCRSSSLLKMKARFDAEFLVTDVVPGEDGLGILVCQMVDGKKFKTLAPGNHGQKREALQKKDRIIGRKVTVEYANLTNDGIPFHCVATGYRDPEL